MPPADSGSFITLSRMVRNRHTWIGSTLIRIGLPAAVTWGAYPSAEEEQAVQREGSFQAIGYQAWWDMPALPKFNTSTPAVREFLFGVAEHWIDFGIDGWRLDVPAEIDDDSFWQEFRRRVRAKQS